MNVNHHDPGGSAATGPHKYSIVFVDDEEAILSSLTSLFRRSGHRLHPFTDAATALEFIARTPADLIISDLRMPGMTGVEFLNKAAAVNPEAVRLILSGYEDKSIVLDALARGLAQHFVLKPWDDTAIRTLVQQSLERLEQVRRQQLEVTLGTMDSLPSPPKFYDRLNSLLARQDVSLEVLAGEIETNPPIVARLLRVANSVFYASRKSVTSVRDAVRFIGTEYISGLISAMEAFQGFREASDTYAKEQIEILWTQAVRRSATVKLIAERWPGLDSPHQVHIASLLQDIGFAVRLCSEPTKYLQFAQLCRDKVMTPYEADACVFGITHDNVGAALLEYWNLPPDIVAGVARHHRLTEGKAFVQILQIGESLEGSDPDAPHDPEVTRIVPAWKAKITGEFLPESTSTHA